MLDKRAQPANDEPCCMSRAGTSQSSIASQGVNFDRLPGLAADLVRRLRQT
jgi:hypothetical protein